MLAQPSAARRAEGKQVGATTGVAQNARLWSSGLVVQVTTTALLGNSSLTLQTAIRERFEDGPADVIDVAVNGGTRRFAGPPASAGPSSWPTATTAQSPAGCTLP